MGSMSSLSALLSLIIAAAPPVGTPLLAPQPMEAQAASVPPVGSPELVAPLPLQETPQPTPTPEPRSPWLGAELDAGLPDGFGASVVLRPWYFVRLHLGGVTDLASGGIRAGLTLAPFHFAVTPILSGELGHLFEGDLSKPLATILGNIEVPDGVLEHVSYTFYSAHLGVEVGAPDRVVIYLRGGISRVEATLRRNSDPKEEQWGATIPSAKLGIRVYFF